MNYIEYGRESRDTVILLHGGGLSQWNYRGVAECLKDRYHVVLPVLDGHAGSDRPFTTIEDSASGILSYIDVLPNGKAALIGGLSLGGQILIEMLSQRPDICSAAIIESAAVIPSKMTHAFVGPAFSCSYGLMKNRTFAKLQFRALHIREELFEDYYRDTCLIGKRDMIAFMKASTSYSLKDSFRRVSADVHVYYGTRETGVIRRSAKQIAQKLPACSVHPLSGLYHGEFSISHPDLYAQEVCRIISGEQTR